MTVTTNSTLIRSADVVACDLSGETALLHFETGIYYGLDATGSRVWELIQNPRSVHELLEVITREYDVDRGQCEDDLISLLQALADEQLVELAPCTI